MADIIAIDLGTKRIGVARADDVTKIPQPLAEISVDGLEFIIIKELLQSYNSTKLVVGLPRNSVGQETKESERIKSVVDKLVTNLDNVEVIFQDESTTSISADEIMGNSSLPYSKESRDSVAAAIILKEYLS